MLQPQLYQHVLRVIAMTGSHMNGTEPLLDLRATEKGYRDAFFAQLEIHLCSSLSCSSSCCE